MAAPAIVLYSTSCPGTSKARSDIATLQLILDVKKIPYEEVRRRQAGAPPQFEHKGAVPAQRASSTVHC